MYICPYIYTELFRRNRHTIHNLHQYAKLVKLQPVCRALIYHVYILPLPLSLYTHCSVGKSIHVILNFEYPARAVTTSTLYARQRFTLKARGIVGWKRRNELRNFTSIIIRGDRREQTIGVSRYRYIYICFFFSGLVCSRLSVSINLGVLLAVYIVTGLSRFYILDIMCTHGCIVYGVKMGEDKNFENERFEMRILCIDL